MATRPQVNTEFLLLPVKLEQDFFSELQKGVSGSGVSAFRVLFADNSHGLQVIIQRGRNHAIFRFLTRPESIFVVISVLLACIKTVERCNPITGKPKDVFDFDSFRDLFQAVEKSLNSHPKRPSGSSLRDLADSLHTDSNTCSKILIFLYGKFTLIAKAEDLLAENDLSECVSKLCSNSMFTTLRTLDTQLFNQVESLRTRQNSKVQGSESISPQVKSLSGMGSNDKSNSMNSPWKIPDAVATAQFFTDTSQQGKLSPSKASNPNLKISGMSSRSRQHPVLPKLDFYRPSEAVFPKSKPQANEFFEEHRYTNLKDNPSRSYMLLESHVLMDELSKALKGTSQTHWISPKTLQAQLLKVLQNFWGANLAFRVQVLMQLTDTIIDVSKKVHYGWTQSIFACDCPNHGFIKNYFFLLATVILDPTLTLYNAGTDSMSEFLGTLSSCKSDTQYLMKERLFLVLDLHQDDTMGDLETTLRDLLADKTEVKDGVWCIKAQLTIRHLIIGLWSPNIRNTDCLKFLKIYIEKTASFYLCGVFSQQYFTEFLACCAQVENLLMIVASHEESEYRTVMQDIYKLFLKELSNLKGRDIGNYQSKLLGSMNSGSNTTLFRMEAIKFVDWTMSKSDADFILNHGNFLTDECLFSFLDPAVEFLNEVGGKSQNLTKIGGSELAISWAAMRTIGVRNLSQTLKQKLQQFTQFLQDVFKLIVDNRGSVALLRARLEHKQLYLQFFSDALDSVPEFNSNHLLDQLVAAFDTITKLQTKQQQINDVLQSLYKLSDKGYILPLGRSQEGGFGHINENEGLQQFEEVYDEVCHHHNSSINAAKWIDHQNYCNLLEGRNLKKPLELAKFEKEAEALEKQMKAAHGQNLQYFDHNHAKFLEEFYSDQQFAAKASESLELDIPVGINMLGLYEVRKKWLTTTNKGTSKTGNSISTDLETVVKKIIGPLEEVIIKHIRELLDKAAYDVANQRMDISSSSTQELISQLTKVKSTLPLNSALEVLKVLVYDRCLSKNLSSIGKLYTQFESKGSSHFQQIIFSSAFTTTGLSSYHILELEKFIKDSKDLRNTTRKADLNKVVTLMQISSRRQLTDKWSFISNPDWFSRIFEAGDSLIRISQNSSQNAENSSLVMQTILQNSTLCFEFDSSLKTYQAQASLTPQPYNRRPTPIKKQENLDVVSLDKMQTMQTQMFIIESAETTLRGGNTATQHESSVKNQANVFVQIVEACETISNSLQTISNLGLICNLSTEIGGQLATLEIAESGKRKMAVVSGRRPAEELIRCEGTTVQVMIGGYGLPVPDISHLLCLNQALQIIVKNLRKTLIHEGASFHQITLLSGSHKLLLANYFLNKDKHKENLSCKTENCLFRFATSLSNDMSLVDCSLLNQHPEKLQTLDVLKEVFSQFRFHEQTKQIETDLGDEDEEMNSTGGQIRYVYTEPERVSTSCWSSSWLSTKDDLTKGNICRSSSSPLQTPPVSKFWSFWCELPKTPTNLSTTLSTRISFKQKCHRLSPSRSRRCFSARPNLHVTRT